MPSSPTRIIVAITCTRGHIYCRSSERARGRDLASTSRKRDPRLSVEYSRRKGAERRGGRKKGKDKHVSIFQREDKRKGGIEGKEAGEIDEVTRGTLIA